MLGHTGVCVSDSRSRREPFADAFDRYLRQRRASAYEGTVGLPVGTDRWASWAYNYQIRVFQGPCLCDMMPIPWEIELHPAIKSTYVGTSRGIRVFLWHHYRETCTGLITWTVTKALTFSTRAQWEGRPGVVQRSRLEQNSLSLSRRSEPARSESADEIYGQYEE